MVGTSGWQLSPRERGRVFLARALLQGADLVVQEKKGRRARSRELGAVPEIGSPPSPQLARDRLSLALQLFYDLASGLAGLVDGPGWEADRANFRMSTAAVAFANRG